MVLWTTAQVVYPHTSREHNTRISNALIGLYSTPTIYNYVLTIVLYLNLIHSLQIANKLMEIYRDRLKRQAARYTLSTCLPRDIRRNAMSENLRRSLIKVILTDAHIGKNKNYLNRF